MIPTFPQFKKIELADKEEIEQFTGQFPSYSDYNFASLWSWNTTDAIAVSRLNNNLAVRFTDYLTGLPFYSFIGVNDVGDTVSQLIELSISEGIEPTLKLIPEVSISGVDASKFKIEADRDNFDYIYEMDTFRLLEDPKLYVKRKHYRHFEKTYPHKVVTLDLTQPVVKDQVIDLFHDWIKSKLEKGASDYFENEYLALLRYLQLAGHLDYLALGVFSEDRLIAVSISEHTGKDFHVSHFQKAINSSYKGLNVFLVHEVAELLHQRGIRHINWEQDLGIAGLRESKESYLPCNYFKKYKLSTL